MKPLDNSVSLKTSVILDDGTSLLFFSFLTEKKLDITPFKNGVGNGVITLNKEKALELSSKLKAWAEA